MIDLEKLCMAITQVCPTSNTFYEDKNKIVINGTIVRLSGQNLVKLPNISFRYHDLESLLKCLRNCDVLPVENITLYKIMKAYRKPIY